MCQTEHGLPIYVSVIYFTLIIGNSLDNSAFQEFVQKRLDERLEKMLISQNQTMEVDSEFAKIFNSNRMVAGRYFFHYLFHSSKR